MSNISPHCVGLSVWPAKSGNEKARETYHSKNTPQVYSDISTGALLCLIPQGVAASAGSFYFICSLSKETTNLEVTVISYSKKKALKAKAAKVVNDRSAEMGLLMYQVDATANRSGISLDMLKESIIDFVRFVQ